MATTPSTTCVAVCLLVSVVIGVASVDDGHWRVVSVGNRNKRVRLNPEPDPTLLRPKWGSAPAVDREAPCRRSLAARRRGLPHRNRLTKWRLSQRVTGPTRTKRKRVHDADAGCDGSAPCAISPALRTRERRRYCDCYAPPSDRRVIYHVTPAGVLACDEHAMVPEPMDVISDVLTVRHGIGDGFGGTCLVMFRRCTGYAGVSAGRSDG